MSKLLTVVMLTVGAVGTARADHVTLPVLGWNLDIAGHDAWTASKQQTEDDLVFDEVDFDQPRIYFHAKLVRDHGACASYLQTVATTNVRDQENVQADERPVYLSKKWYPAVIDNYADAMNIAGCRELAGGDILMLVVETLGPSLDRAPDYRQLVPLVAAIDAAIRANGLDATTVVPKNAVKQLADAIDAAEKQPVSVTLPDLATIQIPNDWEALGSTLRERIAVMPTSLEPKVYLTNIDCAHGMAPRFDTEHLAPVPADAPGFQVATLEEHPAGPHQSGEMWYRLCADIPGGVLVVTRHTSNETKQQLEVAAKILADVLRAARDPARPSTRKPVDLFQLHIKIDPPLGAVWRQNFVPQGPNSVELWKDWPIALDNEVVDVSIDAVACAGNQAFAVLPAGWQGIQEQQLADSKTGAPVAASTYEVCAQTASGSRIHASIHSTRDLPADRAAQVKALLETLGTQLGVTGGVATAPAPAASIAPPAYTSSPTDSAAPPAEPVAPAPSAYTPSTYDSYTPHHSHALRDLVRQMTLVVHQLDARTTGIDDGYGASLGYGRTWRGSGAGTAKLALAAGYDSRSGALADAQLALGWSIADDEVGYAGIYGVVGGDGIGVGNDMAADRITVPFDAYYGVLADIAFGSTDLRFAYVGRSSDAVGHETRFELGYRLGSGHRFAFGYRSLDHSGRFLTLGIGL